MPQSLGMAARDQGNGTDPLIRTMLQQREPLRELVDPIPDNAFEGPIGKRVATALTALVARADQQSEDQAIIHNDVFRAFERSDRKWDAHELALKEIKVLIATGSLPPMRLELPSSSAVASHSRRSFGDFLQQKARETPGGPNVVQATTEELEQAAQKYFEEQMAIYERNKRLKDMEAAEERAMEANKERRSFRAMTVSGIIVAIVTVAGTYLATKAAEHEKGFEEGVKAVSSASSGR